MTEANLPPAKFIDHYLTNLSFESIPGRFLVEAEVSQDFCPAYWLQEWGKVRFKRWGNSFAVVVDKVYFGATVISPNEVSFSVGSSRGTAQIDSSQLRSQLMGFVEEEKETLLSQNVRRLAIHLQAGKREGNFKVAVAKFGDAQLFQRVFGAPLNYLPPARERGQFFVYKGHGVEATMLVKETMCGGFELVFGQFHLGPKLGPGKFDKEEIVACLKVNWEGENVSFWLCGNASHDAVEVKKQVGEEAAKFFEGIINPEKEPPFKELHELLKKASWNEFWSEVMKWGAMFVVTMGLIAIYRHFRPVRPHSTSV